MEIVNAKIPGKILDGNSILPVLKGKSIAERDLFFHFPIYLQAYAGEEDDSRDPLFRTRPGSVIIDSDWKLHHYFEDNEFELYNLSEDIGERKNVIDSHPEKAAYLHKKLNLWRDKIKAPIPTKSNPEYDKFYKGTPNKEDNNQ